MSTNASTEGGLTSEQNARHKKNGSDPLEVKVALLQGTVEDAEERKRWTAEALRLAHENEKELLAEHVAEFGIIIALTYLVR